MLKYLPAFLLMTATVASAQQMSMSDRIALRDNCKQDIQKLCPDIKPGGGQLLACVRENKSELSEACSITITEVMARQKN